MSEKYQPEKCEHCGQTTTYRLGLDKGSAEIVLEILKTVIRKGCNEIHPARELELSGRKKWFLTNLSRPRFHGLIAYVRGKRGYYCLTQKAGKFLRGEPVPKYAIISKITGHQIGYWEPEKYQTTIREILRGGVQWEGDAQRMIDYLDPPIGKTAQMRLFNAQMI